MKSKETYQRDLERSRVMAEKRPIDEIKRDLSKISKETYQKYQ